MASIANVAVNFYTEALREVLLTPPSDARQIQDVQTARIQLNNLAKGNTVVTGAALVNELIGGLGGLISQLCLEQPGLALPGRHGARVRLFTGLLDAAAYGTSLAERYKPLRSNQTAMGDIM